MSPTSRASDEMVSTALRGALESVGIRAPVTALRRRENVYESSHLSEVLDCELHDGSLPPILCKYGPGDDRDHLGLRQGLEYEASVYRDVLESRDATPRFFGSYAGPNSTSTWLFLEYLGEGWQLDLGPETAIADAAAMMGELHLPGSRTWAGQGLPTVNCYDEQYFRRCLGEATALASAWRRRVQQFDYLVEGFERGIELLVTAPQSLVHGEFTPHNVVWADDRPYIVDWEHAGLGPGEIDLAALTDDWDEDLIELATAAYLRTRWPRATPHQFAATLDAARLYWLFRWLGDPHEAGTEEEIGWITERADQVARAHSTR